MSRRVAIIGSGAAGLSAAFHLRDSCRLALFEKNDFFGGHAQTFVVPDGPDAGLPLDVAFMVMNQQKYPTMCSILRALGHIELGASDMSFSYHSASNDIEYALNVDNASARKLPAALMPLIAEILRFCTHARTALAHNNLRDITLMHYLDEFGASAQLRQRYILPMGAALWSAAPGHILQFPAQLYLRFLDNHGLLNPAAGLSWQHIRGGSQVYVSALIDALPDVTLHKSTPVRKIVREDRGVTVYPDNGIQQRFDAVILATHADQALRLLGDASEEESALLAAIRYQENRAVLHWDERVMPRSRDAWASWNYESTSDDEQKNVCISYYLNPLQGHRHAARNYFLTLNRAAPVDEDKVLARFTFEHPVFDGEAFAAQKTLAQCMAHNRTCFAGSYLGYGFHEDAMVAGMQAARSLAALLAG